MRFKHIFYTAGVKENEKPAGRSVFRSAMPLLRNNAGTLFFAVIGIGLLVLAGVKLLGLVVEPGQALKRGVAQQAVLDAGASLTRDVERATQPAVGRGRIIANLPETADALSRQDPARLTEICNQTIQNATEIDVVAMFDAEGKLLAINTVYSDGREVPQQRVDRIMSRDFSERGIIMQCVKNQAHMELLEFQTSCDITPAFFDSSGLSVAHSVPVYDQNGTKVGVVSTRMNFERISSLLQGSKPAGDAGEAWFVTDTGGFFDEDLNSGAVPPIPRDELADAAALLIDHRADQVSFNQDESTYMLFRMSGLTTMEGGGIQAMLSVPDAWLEREAMAASLIGVGTPATGGVLFLALAVLVRFQQQLRVKQAQAEQASRTKSEFLANMSHEIRTPMTAILGYADLLNGDLASEPEKAADAIATIQSNASHLLTIINDILDVSKIEAGQMTVETIDTNPAQIVEEVASLVRPRALSKGIELSVRYDTPIPGYIQSDPTRLRQILLNLVGNAIKFTEVGGVTLHAACDEAGQQMVFRVVDTGIGMTAEQRGAIARFQAFNQADASTTRMFGGTGLGLRISNVLANMLGGGIEIRSEYGKGSTFTVSVGTGDLTGVAMTRPEQAPPEQALKTGQPAMNDQAGAAPEQSLRGIRILLAEDGPDNQRLIQHHLTKAGAQVIICENGLVAVETIEAATAETMPHVVLMDMQMPELDGYSASARLRSNGCTLPIIALTAHAMDGDRQKCQDAGCDDYLTKPIEKAKLISACGQWARKPSGARAPEAA